MGISLASEGLSLVSPRHFSRCCHEPHRQVRIPHENEIKSSKFENGFLVCLIELPRTRTDCLSTETNGDKLCCGDGALHVLNLPCASLTQTDAEA
jgi:hypothetical protein